MSEELAKKEATISLSGLKTLPNGDKVQTNYFNFLDIELDDYSDIVYTESQAKSIRTHMMKLQTGASAAIPLICPGASICPFAQSCQPEGEMVWTVNRGPVKIEDLDEKTDKLWTYHQKQKKIRKTKGHPFKKYERDFSGPLVVFSTKSGHGYRCTPDHHCLAKWTDEAFKEKRCVYLMRKGSNWRIGSTSFLKEYSHGEALGVMQRAAMEKADEAWILGVYDTNTEALLAEEWFSVKWGISRALFIATPFRKNKKYTGLYRWIEQDQLNKHHKSLRPEESHIREKLLSLGLSRDIPLWSKNRKDGASKRLATKQFFRIHAINLVLFSGLFKFVLENEELSTTEASIEHGYTGKVYSLDVSKYHTYITNGVVTHNCPFVRIDKLAKADAIALEEPVPKLVTPVGRRCLVEVNLLTAWTRTYIQEYEVEPTNFSDFQIVQHLAETELLLWRIANNMAKLDNAELTQENLVSVDQQGNPITNKVVSVIFELQERLLNRKQKLIRLMVGDRQEKYKRDAALKQRSEMDASASAAGLRSRLTKMVREADAIEKKLQQAEAIVVDGEYQSEKVSKDPDFVSPEDLINQG